MASVNGADRPPRPPSARTPILRHVDALSTALRICLQDARGLVASPSVDSTEDRRRKAALISMLQGIALLCKNVLQAMEQSKPPVVKVEQCASCHEELDPTSLFVRYNDRCYHISCMRCATCDAAVNGQQFGLGPDGRPICLSCTYTLLFICTLLITCFHAARLAKVPHLLAPHCGRRPRPVWAAFPRGVLQVPALPARHSGRDALLPAQ